MADRYPEGRPPLPAGGGWRYLPGRHVRHWLTDTEGLGAVCGVQAPAYGSLGWHGTGSQQEYEIAAGLSDCQQCQRARGAQ